MRIKDRETENPRLADIEYEPIPERILILAALLQKEMNMRLRQPEDDYPHPPEKFRLH